MSEKNLSEEKKAKIDAIKREWLAEVEKLPELPQKGPCLDGGGGRYREIEKKYLPRIREIIEAPE